MKAQHSLKWVLTLAVLCAFVMADANGRAAASAADARKRILTILRELDATIERSESVMNPDTLQVARSFIDQLDKQISEIKAVEVQQPRLGNPWRTAAPREDFLSDNRNVRNEAYRKAEQVYQEFERHLAELRKKYRTTTEAVREARAREELAREFTGAMTKALENPVVQVGDAVMGHIFALTVFDMKAKVLGKLSARTTALEKLAERLDEAIVDAEKQLRSHRFARATGKFIVDNNRQYAQEKLDKLDELQEQSERLREERGRLRKAQEAAESRSAATNATQSGLAGC